MYAQWTKNDSIWLQNVLSGKDTLKLNIETQKAIESGSFLNTTPHTTPMISNPAILPILKDLSEYTPLVDTTGNKLEISPDLFNFNSPNTPAFKTGMSVDLVHGLNYVFSKEYRQHHKNKKKAEKLKYYNEPSFGVVKGKNKFVGIQEELPLPFVTRRDTSQWNSTKDLQKSTSLSSFGRDLDSREVAADSLSNKTRPN